MAVVEPNAIVHDVQPPSAVLPRWDRESPAEIAKLARVWMSMVFSISVLTYSLSLLVACSAAQIGDGRESWAWLSPRLTGRIFYHQFAVTRIVLRVLPPFRACVGLGQTQSVKGRIAKNLQTILLVSTLFSKVIAFGLSLPPRPMSSFFFGMAC